jgi:hypothetical protein
MHQRDEGDSSNWEGLDWLRDETRKLAESILGPSFERHVHETWHDLLLGLARPLSGGVELIHRRLEELQERLETELAEGRRAWILDIERRHARLDDGPKD